MNTRKHRIRALALILVFSMVLSIGAFAASFTDMEGHWATEAVDYWTERGLLHGYSDGTFQPDEPITRAEVAWFTADVLGLSGTAGQSFTDVPADYWGYSAIEACAAAGVITGDPGGQFRPDDFITREEAMMLVFRITSYTAADPLGALAAAPDGGDTSGWARAAVGTLLGAGAVKGDENGYITPLENITRAEFVTLLYRIEQGKKWDTTGANSVFLLDLGWSNRGNGGTAVRPQTVDSAEYLLLPAAADLTALKLDFLLSDPAVSVTYQGDLGSASAQPFDLTAIASQRTDGSYALTVKLSRRGVEKTYSLRVMASANIGAIFLTSSDPTNYGRDYVEAVKGNSTTGSMVMLDENGGVIYDNTLSQIKSRGNSTFKYDKKPYQIKLGKKTDLAGTGEKVKTWVLLANYADATGFHDGLCKELGTAMGVTGTPDVRWVDLYYDGEYRGTYTLSEKVQISSTGVDAPDLEGDYEDANADYGDNTATATGTNIYGNAISYATGVSDPADISNGYLLELNATAGDEACWFKTTQGKAYNIKAPEFVSQTAAQYVSERFQEFEDAITATNAYGNHTGVNPYTGRDYTELCDLDSLVQMYMILTFSCNYDGYDKSLYFYRANDKFYCGPIWDSDLTFGTGGTAAMAANTDHVETHYLIKDLIQIPSFQKAVKAYYDSTFRPLAEAAVTTTAPGHAQELAASERMNHLLWSSYYRCGLTWYWLYGDPYPAGTTYSQVMENTLSWMRSRISYLDSKFSAWG